MFSKKIFLLIGLILILSGSLLWGEKIELKNGNIVNGAVKQIKDGKVYLDIGESKEIGILLEDIVPLTVYRLRQRFVDPNDAQAHWDLGDYCFKEKLYDQAREEFNTAGEVDGSFKEKAAEKINEVIEEESQILMNSALALMRENRYEDALKNLKELIAKYPDGKYIEEATRAATFAAEVVRHKIEEENKRRELEEKQKEQERVTKEESVLRNKYDEAIKLIKEAKDLNAEGLNDETEFKIPLADKCYKKAIEKIISSQDVLAGVFSQTKNADMIKECKDKLNEVNSWLVGFYNNLGQLWAAQGYFPEAFKWLNKALAIDPANKAASELKVKMIDIEVRKKWLPKEYR